jgi:hypothetical protein
MFSGLAPLNTTTLLQAHIVHTSVICTYFSGYVASILSVPKFVAQANPLACSGPDCTSIFLPGGVEQMRFLNTNFSGTLLQDGFLNGPDAITSYNTPGYQLDFFPPTNFEFDLVRDCTLYGISSGQGLYMCVATDEDQHLVIGGGIILSHFSKDKLIVLQVGAFAQRHGTKMALVSATRLGPRHCNRLSRSQDGSAMRK